MIFYRNLREITFRLTNVIPERIIFVSRGITVYPIVLSWHSAHEGGEVVSLMHRPPLPPEMFLVLIFTRDWVDPRAMVGSEGNMALKNPVTPLEIDPGTVWLVAQRLHHHATPGPDLKSTSVLYWATGYRDSLINKATERQGPTWRISTKGGFT